MHLTPDTQTPDTQGPSARTVFSISDINRRAKELLEIHLPLIWVEGEISNFSQPSSGHWYFTLKDENAQVRCAMFRGRNQQVKFKPSAGDMVFARARVSLYEGRGEFQLIIEHMEEAGYGLLQKRFEELKARLDKEGLFDEIHKQALPEYPVSLAVVTSPTGAVIHDVLKVLKRRYPLLQVTLIPSLVQGDAAVDQLVNGITLANSLDNCDVILLCRGGGSLEDLWAFNSEKLARAIFASNLPLVSAVGHEVDFTIADFVADLRAPTPSAAAELISPNGEELREFFSSISAGFRYVMDQKLRHLRDKLQHLRARLRHPGEKLQHQAQKLDQLEIRLHKAGRSMLDRKKSQYTLLAASLAKPEQQIRRLQMRLGHCNKRLTVQIQNLLTSKQQKIARLSSLLNVVSPLNTLERGYAIVQKNKGEIVQDSAKVKKGDKIAIRLANGQLGAIIEHTD